MQYSCTPNPSLIIEAFPVGSSFAPQYICMCIYIYILMPAVYISVGGKT